MRTVTLKDARSTNRFANLLDYLLSTRLCFCYLDQRGADLQKDLGGRSYGQGEAVPDECQRDLGHGAV